MSKDTRETFKSFAELRASAKWNRILAQLYMEIAAHQPPVMSFERFECDRRERRDAHVPGP